MSKFPAYPVVVNRTSWLPSIALIEKEGYANISNRFRANMAQIPSRVADGMARTGRWTISTGPDGQRIIRKNVQDV